MNKKFTKLLSILALAGVMGVGAFAFAGCNPTTTPPGPGGEQEGPGGEQEGPGGEQEGPGGEQEGPGGEQEGPSTEKVAGLVTFSAESGTIGGDEATMNENVTYTANSVITDVKVCGDGSSANTVIRTGQGTASIDSTDYTYSFKTNGSSLNNSGRIYKRYLALTLAAAGTYEVTVYARNTSAVIDNVNWEAPKVVYDTGVDAGTNVKAYTIRSVSVTSTAPEGSEENPLTIKVGANAGIDIFGIAVKAIENTPATTIELNKTTTTLDVGGSEQLVATMSAGATDYVTWATSNENAVTVDGNGNIQAVGEGTATITATAHLGLSASCTVTVNAAAGASGTYTIDFSSSSGSGVVKTVTPNESGISVVTGDCQGGSDNTLGNHLKFGSDSHKLTIKAFGLRAGQTITLTVNAADFSNNKNIDAAVSLTNATGPDSIAVNGDATTKSTAWDEKTITLTVEADGDVTIEITRSGGGTLIIKDIVMTIGEAA